MPRMRHACSCAETRTRCEGKSRRLRDLGKRIGIELRRHLAQEPCAIAPRALAVLAFPLAVLPMVLGIGLTALASGLAIGARVLACAALSGEDLMTMGLIPSFSASSVISAVSMMTPKT